MNSFERRLGLPSVIFISIGAMLGSGVFVLPGIVISEVGSWAWLAYLLAAICILPAAMSKSELATAMPTSGGTYVYLERTFGPLVGTIAGLGLWSSLLLKSSFALLGLGAYLSIISDFPMKATALSLLAVIGLLNVWGVSKVSKALALVVILSFTSILSLSFGSLFLLPSFSENSIDSIELKNILSTSALVFISYAGVTKVAAIAEEIKNPEKNLHRGILFSLLFVTFVYCLISYVLAKKIPLSLFKDNLKPVYDLAFSLGGNSLGWVFAIVGCLTMASMANAGVLAASRFPFAMARDKLLPSFLGKINSQFLTPIWSILLSCSLIVFFILFLDIEKIVKIASAFMILVYIAENLAVIILRELRVQWYKPDYEAPFYPFVQIFGILSGFLLLFFLGVANFFISFMSATVIGIVIYFFWGRKLVQRKGLLALRGGKSFSAKSSQANQNKGSSLEGVLEKCDVFVALFGEEHSPEMLVELGGVLGGDQGSVGVVYVKEIPEQTDIKDLDLNSYVVRSLRRRVMAVGQNNNYKVSFNPIFTHDIYQSNYIACSGMKARWMIAQWSGFSRGNLTFHNPVGWLRNHLCCNFIVFKDEGVRSFKKNVLLLKETKDDLLNLYVIDHISMFHGGKLDLVLYLPQKVSKERESQATDYAQTLADKCKSPVKIKLIKTDGSFEDMLEMTTQYDLFVLENASPKTIKEKLRGSKNDSLIQKAECSVIAIHRQDRDKD